MEEGCRGGWSFEKDVRGEVRKVVGGWTRRKVEQHLRIEKEEEKEVKKEVVKGVEKEEEKEVKKVVVKGVEKEEE